MFRRTFISCCLAIALFGTLLPAAPARGEGPKDALQLIPDDAWGFVVLKSLNNLDAKAIHLKELLGLQYPTPVTPMALGMLNLVDKVDSDQPVCIVLMDAKKYGGGMNPGAATILLMPAKDAKALVQSLTPKDVEPEGEEEQQEGKEGGQKEKEGKKKEGAAGEEGLEEGISKIKVMGQTAYAAVKGKYVIVGQNQECVATAAKAKKSMADGFAEARLSALNGSDLYLSLSVKTVVGATKDMWMPLLQMLTAPTDPEGKNVKTFVKLLEEAAAFDLSLKLDKGGFTVLALALPEKDSDLEKLMKDGKNMDKSLLAMLPSEKYLVATASTGGYSEHSEKFGGQSWLADMVKQGGAKGLNEESIKTLDAELLKLARGSGPSAMCLSFQPEGADGMFGMTWVWQAKDPKETVESLRKIYKTAWTVAEGGGKAKKATEKKEADDEEEKEGEDEQEGEDEADAKPAEWKDDLAKVKENIIHAAEAETIDGIKVDTITVKLEGLGELLDVEADEIGLLQKVVGKEIVVRFGVADGKHFMLTVGGGKKRFEAACKHLKSPGESLDKEASIKESLGVLPGSRGFELFIAVDNVLQAIKAVAKTLGEEEEFPVDMPTINAPLAISSAMIGSVAQINIVIPTKLITAVKEVIDKQMAAGSADFDEDDEDEEGDKDADKDDDEDDDSGGKGKEDKDEDE